MWRSNRTVTKSDGPGVVSSVSTNTVQSTGIYQHIVSPPSILFSSIYRARRSGPVAMFCSRISSRAGRDAPGGAATMTLAQWWTPKPRARPTAGGLCSRRPQRLIFDQQRASNWRRSCCNTRNNTYNTRHLVIHHVMSNVSERKL